MLKFGASDGYVHGHGSTQLVLKINIIADYAWVEDRKINNNFFLCLVVKNVYERR